MRIEIVRDIIIGGAFAGLFSYIVSLYHDSPSYLKALAFFWGLPLLYFYMIIISWRTGYDAAIDFTKHAIAGTTITMLVMFFSLFLCKTVGKYTCIFINLFILFAVIFIYMNFKMYQY
jgi:hypothetical protein